MLFNSLVISALLSSVNASPLYKRAENETTTETNSTVPDYIQFDWIDKDLFSGPDFKAIEVTIGSDNQTLLLKLDSKTSDFWVNSDLNEFCLAYSELEEIESTLASNTSDWVEFNNELKEYYDEEIEEFELESDAKLQSLIASQKSAYSVYKTASSHASKATANVVSEFKSYFQGRKSAYQSLVSQQLSSVTKEISEFLETATVTPTVISARPSSSAAVSSYASASASAVAEADDDENLDIWGSLTSNIADALEKREDGWEKFTSGAAKFFEGLKKRDDMVMTVNGVVTTMDMAGMDSTTTEESSAAAAASTDAAEQQFASTSTAYRTVAATETVGAFQSVETEATSETVSESESSTAASGRSAVQSRSAAQGYSSAAAGASSAVGSAGHRSTAHSSAVASSSAYVAPVQTSSSVAPVVPSSTIEVDTPVETVDVAELVEALIFESTKDCSLYGVYNDSSSETFQTTDGYFISDDGYTYGVVGNDTVTLSDDVSFNTTFGIADASDSNVGVLGLGKSNENSTFQSLPYILADNGYISKALFSLYISSNTSSLIFGAIDYSRIDGNITVFPLLNETDAIALTLTNLNVTVLDETTTEIYNNETSAIIDTTSNNVLLPNETFYELVDSLNSTFNVTFDDVFERYTLSVLDEDYTPADVFLTFGFDGESFDVALSNFVIPVSEATFFYNESTGYAGAQNRSFYFDVSDEGSDNSTYILSILPSATDDVILGLDFLLDTIVVVVDLDAEEIGLAYNSGLESNATYILSPFDEDYEF